MEEDNKISEKDVLHFIIKHFNLKKDSLVEDIRAHICDGDNAFKLIGALMEQNKLKQAEIDEYDQSFELYHNALLRGTVIFRKLNPDYPISSYPDTGKMMESICAHIEDLKVQHEKDRIKHTYDEFSYRLKIITSKN